MEDLTGRVFGILKVLGSERKSGQLLWKCECACKDTDRNIVYVTTSHLVSGNTKSCGCLALKVRKQNGEMRKENLTDQRFGRLVAKRIVPQIKSKSPTWECFCDCGNICYVTAQNLKNNSTRSCGCLLEENIKRLGKESWENVLKKKYINGTITDFLFNPGKIRKDNTCGYPGIEERKRDGKWVAKLTFSGKSYWLGSYYNKSEAIFARMNAEDEVIEEFMRQLKEKDAEKFLELEKVMKDTKRDELKQEIQTEIKNKDLSGKCFGKLTIINEIEEYRNKEKIWRCKCKCEKIVFYTTSEIIDKGFISCNENINDCITSEDNGTARGVTWDKSRGKWMVTISVQHKAYLLVRTSNPEYAQYIADTARWHKNNGDFIEWYDQFKNGK